MSNARTVLIVDDERLLHITAVKTAETLGFNAVEARHADEAISILEKRPQIHVVFTDVNMPGSMDGLKLAHYVRNRWPVIKIITTSGKARLSPFELPPGGLFLPKPYTVSQLRKTLRAITADTTTFGSEATPPAL